MSQSRSALKHWLVVIGWMLIIFGASSDFGASRNTSRIIGPFVRWLYPQISDQKLGEVVFLVRKTAHVTEYAILCILAWRALEQSPRRIGRGDWEWRTGLLAWAFAAGYAATDEIHQAFVPSRTGQWQDVALDSSGAFLGMLLCWIWQTRIRRTRPAEALTPPSAD